MAKLFKSSILLGASILMLNCGGSSVELGTIDDLPQATAPVLGNSLAIASVSLNSAATGLTLKDLAGTAFNAATSSRAMCEVAGATREALENAGQSDKILCYVKNVMSASANATALSAAEVNIYDGSDHVLALDFGAGNVAKIKMKIVKSGNSITTFKMYMCQNGTTQSEYLNQTISGSNVTINSKNVGGESGNTWKSDFSVTGKLNAEGAFTEKTLTSLSYNGNGTSTGATSATFNQYTNAMKASSYQTWTSGSNTNSNKVYANYELLGTDSLGTIAIGDGTLKTESTGSWGGNPWTWSVTEAWTGDTKAVVTPASNGAFYATVTAANLPATDPTATAAAITFTVGAADYWDCGGTAEATLSVDQTILDAACTNFSLYSGSDRDWLNCYDIFN